MEPSSQSRKETPSTLSTSISTPFIDAYENVTKEFDQFYGYISKVMTPRRTRSQAGKIYKPTAKIRKDFDRRRTMTDSTSITPIMDQHSIVDSCRDNQYVSTPTHQRRQRDYPPPRPMTLTPNTNRTTPSVCLQPEDMEEDLERMRNVYIHSPHRSTGGTSTMTPNRLLNHSPAKSTVDLSTCPPSPSLMVHNHLLNESRRLEELQKSILLVQQQSLALSSHHGSSPTHQLFTRGSGTRRQSFESSIDMHKSPFTHIQRPVSFTPTRTTKVPQRHLPTSQSPPPGSPNVPQYHQEPFTTTSIPKATTSVETAYPSNKIPHDTSLPSQTEDPQSMQDLLNDIPKARLRSTKTITTPNGTRIKNRFWEEIHGSASISTSRQKRKSLDEDEMFWINPEKGVDDQTYTNKHRRQQYNISGQEETHSLANRLEQTKPDHEQQLAHNTRSCQRQHYPADFFEELSHTLKNKPTTNDDNDSTL